MKSDLSAFIDDELEDRRQATVLSAAARDERLRCAWDSYHLIGDALRGAPVLDRRLTARVMERLEREPVLLAPRSRRGGQQFRASLAVAATAAGVALVAWVALGPAASPPVPTPALARAPASASAGVAERVASGRSEASGRLQEYMVAHQTYSPANHILGGTAYVRTVSAATR